MTEIIKIKKGQRRCKNCKVVFEKQFPLQMVCSPKCAIERNKKVSDAKEKKEWNTRKKDLKEKSKTIADWKNELQGVINWIVKEIDKDQPCISHPELKGFLRYDAGHYFGVKAHSDLRFHMHNLHKQSSEANQIHGGGPDYARGLKVRYGIEYLEMVLAMPLRWQGTAKEKFTIPNIRDEYLPAARFIKREMKKGVEFTRDQVNEIIGIYV